MMWATSLRLFPYQHGLVQPPKVAWERGLWYGAHVQECGSHGSFWVFLASPDPLLGNLYIES